MNNRKSLYIPGLKGNTVLQLIIFVTVMYLMLAVSWAIIKLVYVGNESTFFDYFMPAISLGNLQVIKGHWWTFITYFWFQEPHTFMLLISNMVWFYIFGSVVQELWGPRTIFPLFIYGGVFGGLAYTVALAIPQYANVGNIQILGSMGSVAAFATAAITMSPTYKYFVAENISVPMILVVGIYVILAVLFTNFSILNLSFYFGGALAGFIFAKLTLAGYRPGAWMYAIVDGLENSVTPKAEQRARQIPLKPSKTKPLQHFPGSGVDQQKEIDRVLDKINSKGYESLTPAEKKILEDMSKS
jgi:membrane associated rhomboid family serine protease